MTVNGCGECARMREAVHVALEALEVGDRGEAYACLEAALDRFPSVLREECPYCLVRFEWPGQLAHHLRVAHPFEAAA